MKTQHDKSNLEGILETVEEAGDNPNRVSVEEMLEEIGRDAFPAIILVPALIVASPASAIPGLPTICALIIALAAIQMIFRRKSLWLPKFLLRRSVRRTTLERAVHWLSRPAHYVDRLIGLRLVYLTKPPFRQLVALICLAIACALPVMELVPLSSSVVATAVAFLALGLVAGDGLLVLIGMTVVAGVAGLGGYLLLR